MIAVFRSELLKQRTTRTTLALLVTMIALVVFAAVLHSFALTTGDLATRDGQMKVFGWGEIGGLFAGLLGAISITAEIRHGTVRPTFLLTPRRWRVIVAKLGVGPSPGSRSGSSPRQSQSGSAAQPFRRAAFRSSSGATTTPSCS